MQHKKPPFIAGNWKMHMTIPEARALVSAVVKESPGLAEAEIILIPPFTALGETARLLLDSPVKLGAQNLFYEDKGAYTGEIAGPMLADAGCRYVLVGHSERRQYFSETDASINKKVLAAFRAGLKPIFCIGETLEEREDGRTISRIESQLRQGLVGVTAEAFADIVLAYEPVWAIGTGKTATAAQAEEVQARIRDNLAENYGKEAAACAIILYGGSVKPANSYSLFREKNIDGFLVGGASLEADSFIQITKEAIKAYKEKQ